MVEVTLNQEIVSLLDREGLILAAWEDVLLAPALTSSVSLVRAPQAWARRGNEPSDGRGQMVVVIDTGVNGGHDFLKTKDGSKVVYEGCFSKGTRYDPVCPGKLPESSGPGSAAPCDMRVDPICEHGTQVAGIIAGSNGRFGKASFSGVAPGARLIAIQTFQKVTGADECKLSEDKRTDGKRVDPALCFRMPIANLLAALQNVVDLADSFPIAAVNVSVSLPDLWRNHCAERLYFHIARTVQDLRVRGIAVIAATGNDGQPEAIAAPSCVPGVIAVAGSDKADNIDLSYSNRNHLVELVAPGTAILSSALTEIYKPGSGTSFAAAHVSGAWAVLKSIDPRRLRGHDQGRPFLDGRDADRRGQASSADRPGQGSCDRSGRP
ncbi:MAG: S8 family serine peptidase [Pseudomonadota bacterium]